MNSAGYDYVIVGGGSAGCVLAARLSENDALRVLLIEAGGKDNHPLIHMPVGFAKMTTGPHTWGLKTAPQKHANMREIEYAQARVLGGGSSINAEVSAAVLLNKHLAVGIEYRQKPDNLGLKEDDWQDVFIAWFPNKHVNLTLAYLDLGTIAALPNQTGWYLSLSGSY